MLMADGGDSSSSSDSDATSRALDEKDVRCLFAREREHATTDAVVDQQFDLLLSVGSLCFPAVLDTLLRNRRWPEIARYLRHALKYHAKEAAEAVGYPPARADDMRRAHPDLYVLPRRQHALDLVRDGKRVEALHYFQGRIRARIITVRRNAHVDNLVSSLREIVDGEKPLDHNAEVAMTCRAIRDYLQLYFPRFCSDAIMICLSQNKLGQAWAFGEVVRPGNELDLTTSIRCLVCHARLAPTTSPDALLVEHLDMECPAVTPRLRKLLPRAHNPRLWKRRQQLIHKDEADAAAAAAEVGGADADNAAGAPPGPDAGAGADGSDAPPAM